MKQNAHYNLDKATTKPSSGPAPEGDGAPDFTEISPEAVAAGVSALNACVSDAPRILPDDEIGGRIIRAVQKYLDEGKTRKSSRIQ
jgi:hypothetical protein